MKRILAILAALLTILGTAASALADSDLAAMKRMIAERLPGASVDYVAPSPIKGIYQVGVDGGDIVYVSADGRYLLSGKMIDLETKEDLTERVLAAQRVEVLSGVTEASMIIFEPEGEVKHTLTTFTDIDCPYCRKMHKEMPLLNSMGIRVRYMWFPRAGVGSLSYQKAVSVWCAEDQKAEMTLAKTGVIPKVRKCKNPIREQMVLAQRMGLRGTPYTITDTGRPITGYMPAKKLFASLEADKLKASR